MFFDWLNVYQDHHMILPVVGDRVINVCDALTGEHLHTRQTSVKHAGSYCTSVVIQISGTRITMSGNPSRYGRQDNLFGFTSIADCIEVYNKILTSYGLPIFTKCRCIDWLQTKESKKPVRVSDGAIITEIHATTNIALGQFNVDDFIKGMSVLPYRNMQPRLHTNGKTCDWLTKGCKGSDRIYPSVYNKAYELRLNSLLKAKRNFGETSDEYQYLLQLIDYCEYFGVARFEQKFKRQFLREQKICFFGLDDFTRLKAVHDDFLKLPERLKVESMDFENISQQLISNGVCSGTRSANTTAMYALQWMHGQVFDLNKKQVQTHRARLRQIGIDIALTCDISKFSLVVATRSRQVTMSDLPVPHWYVEPSVNYQAQVA